MMRRSLLPAFTLSTVISTIGGCAVEPYDSAAAPDLAKQEIIFHNDFDSSQVGLTPLIYPDSSPPGDRVGIEPNAEFVKVVQSNVLGSKALAWIRKPDIADDAGTTVTFSSKPLRQRSGVVRVGFEVAYLCSNAMPDETFTLDVYSVLKNRVEAVRLVGTFEEEVDGSTTSPGLALAVDREGEHEPIAVLPCDRAVATELIIDSDAGIRGLTIQDRLLGGSIVNLLDVSGYSLERTDPGFAAPGHSVVLEVTHRYDGADNQRPVLMMDDIKMTQEDPAS